MKKNTQHIFVLGFVFLALLPLFFIYFRLTAFQTFPFDNYYDYVLYLDGKRAYAVLGAPSGYRFAYYGTAFLWYKVLPVIPLSKLAVSENPDEIRALQALAFTSFLFVYAFFCTVFLLLRNRLNKPAGLSIAVASLMVLLSWYAAPYGADSLFLFYTALCLYFIKKPYIAGGLIILSPVVNEKIGLVFTFFFLGMLVGEIKWKQVVFPLLISVSSVCLYLLIRHWVDLPTGIYTYQTDVFRFWDSVQSSYPALVSVKGFYMNWIPFVLLMILAFAGRRAGIFHKKELYLHPVIQVLPLFLFGLGIVMCRDFTIGRIAMHALPFYAVPLCLLMERLDQ